MHINRQSHLAVFTLNSNIGLTIEFKKLQSKDG